MAKPLTEYNTLSNPSLMDSWGRHSLLQAQEMLCRASHPCSAWFCQFIVEGDASDTGAGVLLSPCPILDQKLYPWSCFSHPLSPTECNYDVGNHDLKEWRYCLEVVKHPFIVCQTIRTLHTFRQINALTHVKQVGCSSMANSISPSPTALALTWEINHVVKGP